MVVYFPARPPIRVIAGAKCDMLVPRGMSFEGSFVAIMHLWLEVLRKRLMVKSEGEDALDHGDISHEWLFLLSHDVFMFNPSYGLFSIFERRLSYTLLTNPA